MELLDVAKILLGVVLGALSRIYAPVLHKRITEYIAERKREKRKGLLRQVDLLYNWLVGYYTNSQSQNDLYDCKIGSYEAKIPFLTRRNWQYVSRIRPDGQQILEHSDSSQKPFLVEKSLISYREGLGQKLFDNPALYLDRIEQFGDGVKLHVKTCKYFEIASSIIKTEEETFHAFRRRSYKGLSIRDKYFSSIAKAEQVLGKPYSIGCAFVLALKIRGSYKIVIHTRSHSTITFGGLKAVTPNFGLAPLLGSRSNRAYGSNSSSNVDTIGSIDLLYYNFVKEYLEELFNYEELIDQMGSRKANPYWFFDLPEAKQLEQLIENGMFSVDFIGFGFDALNGNGIVALLGKIDDEPHSLKLQKELELNWEIASENGDLDLEFIDIHSPDLERWLRENKYHTGAAFAISRALKVLAG